MYEYTVEIIQEGGTTSLYPSPVITLEVQTDPRVTTTEVSVQGPQGPPGKDLLLVLEAGVNTVPAGTPDGTIVFQKA